MTLFYDLIFILFSIAYLPYLVFTGRYHKDFWQRFGFYPRGVISRLKDKKVIWVHAVSVGEVVVARSFCEGLLKECPENTFVISTTTKTGNGIAKKFFGDRLVVLYLPIDISYIVNRALNKIKPKFFIIVETEIWPNLIMALHKRGIPVVLINGRISSKSYRNYMKIRFLIKDILKKVTLFSMQNNEYKDRITDMGAPAGKVIITGNMKFDAARRTPASERLNTDAIRSDLNMTEDQLLFIAGSTHRPEERIILSVYKELVRDNINLKLLIAPRHIERTKEIEKLIRKFGFTPVRISKIAQHAIRNTQYEKQVLLLDTMGRLSMLFSLATVVFMGGSLVRKGGQNILEPAVFSKPIIFGPHMFNFKDMQERFLKEDAACMVKDRGELFKAVELLLKDSKRREGLGSRAKAILEKSRGATERNVEAIAKVIGA